MYHRFRVLTFYIDVSFITVTVHFYEMETICFNTTNQLISLSTMNEGKQMLPSVAFFSCYFRVLLTAYFLFMSRALVLLSLSVMRTTLP